LDKDGLRPKKGLEAFFMSKIKKYTAASLFALAFISSPLMAQDESYYAAPADDNATDIVEDLTLKNWRLLDIRERQATVLAAVESLFLAGVSDPRIAALTTDKCLQNITPLDIEKKIFKQSEKYPDKTFSSALLEIITCSGKN